MASVRDTVYHLLVAYPTIYSNVADCYRHLFLMIGNGYEWVDGELVDVCGDRNRPWKVPQFQDEMTEVLKQDDSSEYCQGQKRLDVRRRNNQIQFVIDNFDLMFEESIQFDRLNDFSHSRYERIFNIPDDVKPDWLESAKRVIDAVMFYCNMCGTRRFDAEKTRDMMEQLSHDRLGDFIVKRENILKQMLDALKIED